MVLSEDFQGERIKASLIIEVLGKPKEHLVETLNKIVDSIDGEKEVGVKERNVKEPVEIKDKEGFFTNFVEVEVECERVDGLFGIVFKYMPSHVEILSPEKIIVKNSELSEALSVLTSKLHRYDEIAGVMQSEKKILENKLRELLGKNKEQ